jgi:hypothetical protein
VVNRYRPLKYGYLSPFQKAVTECFFAIFNP